MRVNTFFMKSETLTVAGGSENFSIVGSDSSISVTDQVFQAATPAGASNYGNYNIFVSSVSNIGGTATGNFSRSAPTPEVASDSVDSFQIVAR